MTRLVRPLVYVLGFSVFCACTTTRTVDISQVEPGQKVDRLVWVFMKEDGSRILLRDTYRTSQSLIGQGEEGVTIEIPLHRVREVRSLKATPLPAILAVSVVGGLPSSRSRPVVTRSVAGSFRAEEATILSPGIAFNPVNPTTAISYDLARPSNVTLSVFDV